MLLDGTASFAAAHDAARMRDEAVLRERAKVRYLPDPELAALLPARVAVVEVTLRDGTRFSERVEAVRGTVRNPMERDESLPKRVTSSSRCSGVPLPAACSRRSSR